MSENTNTRGSSAAIIGCQLAGGLRHYEVISPEHCIHPGNPYGYSPEPPEWGCCWQVFEAESPAKAKARAVQCADFSSWFDNVDNPFKGLRAKLFRCPHGACIGCIEDEACSECMTELGLDSGSASSDNSAIAVPSQDGHNLRDTGRHSAR